MTEKLPSRAVRPDDDEYPILRPGAMQEMLELFQENVGAGGVNELDLPRIKCPPGGATTWLLQTLEGEQPAKEIEGIVLAWKPGRIYWKDAPAEAGGGRRPDCVSKDGFMGTGDPGGACATCPLAQFGTASKGHGQACKQIRRLLLVRPGEVLPYLLSVPPTSLKSAGRHFLMLFGRQTPYWAVTTRIRLEKATNDDGKPFARMEFLLGRYLSPEEKATLAPYHQEMRKLLDPVAVDADDYAGEPAPPAEADSDNKIPF